MGAEPQSSERSKVAFVASLPHSGSTILDLTLSAHPKAVGLGEVAVYFGFYRTQPELLTNKPCTCGRLYSECPFWSKVHQALDAGAPTNDRECYRVLLKCFRDEFGSDAILIDSSKRRKHLTDLVSTGADVRVIALIRDVRSWVVSRRRLESSVSLKQLVRTKGVRGLRERLSLTAPWLFIRWYRLNRALDRTRVELRCDGLRVGYEEFATTTDRVLARLWEFLDLEPHEDVMSLEPNTHILYGNSMRKDQSLRSGIFYDTRWLSDSSWHVAAATLVPVMRYNAKEVYSGGQLLPFGPDKHLHSANTEASG